MFYWAVKSILHFADIGRLSPHITESGQFSILAHNCLLCRRLIRLPVYSLFFCNLSTSVSGMRNRSYGQFKCAFYSIFFLICFFRRLPTSVNRKPSRTISNITNFPTGRVNGAVRAPIAGVCQTTLPITLLY